MSDFIMDTIIYIGKIRSLKILRDISPIRAFDNNEKAIYMSLL